ncbi:MAG: hypothetical protein K2Q06_15505, partial [Parvularculaceae bacterium]|nr:hypothetical protein [Parvularculaceae bacterium]
MRGAPVILGLGGVAAAAAAAYFGGLAGPKQTDSARSEPQDMSATVSSRGVDGGDDKICLRAEIGIAEVKKGSCYLRREFASMERNPIRDADGNAVTVSLAHPTDYDREPAQVKTCAEYNGLI